MRWEASHGGATFSRLGIASRKRSLTSILPRFIPVIRPHRTNRPFFIPMDLEWCPSSGIRRAAAGGRRQRPHPRRSGRTPRGTSASLGRAARIVRHRLEAGQRRRGSGPICAGLRDWQAACQRIDCNVMVMSLAMGGIISAKAAPPCRSWHGGAFFALLSDRPGLGADRSTGAWRWRGSRFTVFRRVRSKGDHHGKNRQVQAPGCRPWTTNHRGRPIPRLAVEAEPIRESDERGNSAPPRRFDLMGVIKGFYDSLEDG